jgi:hypothetical protein
VSEHSFSDAKITKAAADMGLVVRYPTDYEIFLDIDDEESYAHFKDMLQHVPDVVKVDETPSKSGNRHVVLTMKTQLSHLRRIAYQAILGSDRYHELLSLLSLPTCENPTVFFEKP